MAKQVVFFEAEDSNLNLGLWESDGTTAGTYQVGGLDSKNIAGASTTFDPINLAAFRGGVLFRAIDTAGAGGLWFSDGTVQGTYEIGGLKNAGIGGVYTNLSGFLPYNILTFGSRALLFGRDSSGWAGLWVTDGTAAGTKELGGLRNAGITGAYALGFAPQNLTVFGNHVLFSAADTDNYRGLWITDGTTAGTFEIGGLKNAGIPGVPTLASYSLSPGSFVSMGSKAMFLARDASYSQSLWVTDGTAKGTFEIGGAHNNPVSGQAPGGLFPRQVISIGSKALFSGYDGKLIPAEGLWVTDGTIAGTTEVGGLGDAGVTNANPNLGLSPVQMTAFGANKAVFLGFDTSVGASLQELWATDGTVKGTVEMGGLGNAGLAGVGPSGLNTTHLTSIGNKVVFEGTDASGLRTLWVTDGTTAGTFEIGGVNNAGVKGAPAGGLRTDSFIASGSVAYFEAMDEATGQSLGLWVTDGTVAGTHAVSEVSGAYNPTLSDALGITAASVSPAPAVTAISAKASAKDLNAGKTVTVTLATSEAVKVTGKPTLTLNDGGAATYDAAKSSATSLVFDYTVLAGQNTANLTVTKVSLPAGASITDAAGKALAAALPSSAALGLQIDTTSPTVAGAAASPSSGTVSTGSTVAITLKTSEAVTVTGTPTLLLNDGGLALYDPKHSTATSLVFDYTVPSNQGTSALSVIGIELRSTSAIEDGAGNAAQLSGAAASFKVKVNTISTGPANVTISGTQEAEIFGASAQRATFASGADGALKLDAAQSFTGKIAGLTAADTLDLANLAFGPHMTVGYSGTSAGGVLTVSNGAQTDKIALLGNYMASTFTLHSDGHGGTNVIDPPKAAHTPLIAPSHV